MEEPSKDLFFLYGYFVEIRHVNFAETIEKQNSNKLKLYMKKQETTGKKRPSFNKNHYAAPLKNLLLSLLNVSLFC